MTPNIAPDSPPSRRLTVIVIRKFGKISSYEFSSHWLTALLIVFILLAAAAGWFYYENRSLKIERQKLLAQLFLPSSETGAASPKMAEPSLGKEASEDSSLAVEPEEVEEKEPVQTAATTTETTSTTTTSLITTTTTTATTTTALASLTGPAEEEPTATSQVEVDKVAIDQLSDPKGIRFSFRLINQSESKISGYTFLVAKDKSRSPPLYLPFPRDAALSLDRPANHKEGVYFSIQQFKTIRGRIYSKDVLSELEILVYNIEGKLLLSKTIEVPSG